jgi:hypothetical protein
MVDGKHRGMRRRRFPHGADQPLVAGHHMCRYGNVVLDFALHSHEAPRRFFVAAHLTPHAAPPPGMLRKMTSVDAAIAWWACTIIAGTLRGGRLTL